MTTLETVLIIVLILLVVAFAVWLVSRVAIAKNKPLEERSILPPQAAGHQPTSAPTTRLRQTRIVDGSRMTNWNPEQGQTMSENKPQASAPQQARLKDDETTTENERAHAYDKSRKLTILAIREPENPYDASTDERAAREKNVFIVSPLWLPVFGAIFFATLWLIFVGFTQQGTAYRKAAVLGGGIIAVGAWILCWKQTPEKKSKEKGKEGEEEKLPDSQIPDGHVGVLQIAEIPIKFFILTEGKLWLPPFTNVEFRDTRMSTEKIPPSPKDTGFGGIISSNGIQMEAHVSAMFGVDPERPYEAIFKNKPGSALTSMKDELVTSLRELAPYFSARQLLQEGQGPRDLMLHGFETFEEIDGKANWVYHPGIIERLNKRAAIVAMKISPKSISLVKIYPADEKVRDAMSKEATTRLEVDANKVKADAISALADKLIDRGMGSLEAHKSAMIQFGQITMQIIAFEGKPPEGVLTQLTPESVSKQVVENTRSEDKDKNKKGKGKDKDK